MRLLAKNELDTTKKLLVLGWFSDDKNHYEKTNPEVHKKIMSSLKNKTFSDKLGSATRLAINDSVYEEILIISLGEKNKTEPDSIRRALSKGVNYAKQHKYESFTTNISELATPYMKIEDLGLACGESSVLSNYAFNKYSSKAKDEVRVKEIVFLQTKKQKEFSENLTKGKIIGEATNYTKELVNEPACIANPSYLEQEAKKLAKNPLISLKVLKKKDLEKRGMNLILSVGKGSVNEPRMLILEYKGSKNKEINYAILGKGITFDSGGYNIKPTGYMEEMKSDMAGAAAVLGVAKATAELKTKMNISFIIPLAENMISSKAYRPSDIIKAMNGKTVEIINTDAEGRLILADALSYAEKKYKNATLIDIATLTGASVFATGHFAAPIVGNDSSLINNLKTAGFKSGDRLWELPFFEDYQELMDSDIADVANISKKFDRSAGVITGGVFLSKFINGAKWAHIDIGGTAFLKEAFFYNQKYATGSGVRVLTYFIINQTKK